MTMKHILTLALMVFSLSAFADDKTTTEQKTEVESGKSGAKRKSTSKKTHDPGGLGNSTTDKSTTESSVDVKSNGNTEATAEKTVKHDAPGMANDSKTTSKTKVVRDANGNVVEEKIENK